MTAKILKVLLICLLFFLIWGVVGYFTLPDGAEFKTKNPRNTALMAKRAKEYQKAGKNIPLRWQWVPLSKISPYLIQATILAEDSRFYEHAGFDIEALKFALEKNLARKKYALGGSTITQQLARNLYLSPRKSIIRKIKEIIIAYKMERVLTKRRILELYLNVIELGRGIYGVEAAAQHYFHKSAGDLTVAEAVQLVSIYPSPRRHFPGDGTKFTTSRYRRLVKWMFQTGRIDSLTYYDLSGIAVPTNSFSNDTTEELDPTYDEPDGEDAVSDSLSK